MIVAQLCLTLCNPWTIPQQTPLSMEFSRQEYWSGMSFPSPKVNIDGVNRIAERHRPDSDDEFGASKLSID